jgi:hypothetical protein
MLPLYCGPNCRPFAPLETYPASSHLISPSIILCTATSLFHPHCSIVHIIIKGGFPELGLPLHLVPFITLLALTRAYLRTSNPLSPQEIAFPLAICFEGLGALFNLDTIRHIWITGPLLGLGFDFECLSFNLGSVVRNVSGTQSGSREPSSHRVSPLIDHRIHNLKYHHHTPS